MHGTVNMKFVGNKHSLHKNHDLFTSMWLGEKIFTYSTSGDAEIKLQ